MELEQNDALQQYRQQLLESLRDLPRRQQAGRPERIQVFVNQDCVGVLDAGHLDPQFAFACRDRSVQLVELRGESGTLIGGLSAPELGIRSMRLPWSGRTLNVTVHNRLEGGSLRVATLAVPSVWTKIGQAVGTLMPAGDEVGLQSAALRGLAAAQVVVLVAVGSLAVDRLVERTQRPDGATTVATAVGHEIVSAAQTRDAINRLEEKVAVVLAAQANSAQALSGQQKTIQTVQRALDELAQQQKQIGTQMVSVQQMEEHQDRIAQRATADMERMAKVLMGQVQSERVQLRDELHSLSMANEHLAKYVSSMEKRNQELAGRLRAAGIEVSSRAKDAGDAPVLLAKDKEATETGTGAPQAAESRSDASSLKFFVSFQEGTTEESIDRWFQDLHARKGDADSGWYSVEVPRPPQQPTERFIEGLKSVKIIKAVATSRTRLPAAR